MTADTTPYNLPISDRPPRTWSQTLNAVLFTIAFNVGCLMTHGFQIVFLMPLLVLPFEWSRDLYERGVRYTKGSFATLLSEYYKQILLCLRSDGATVLMNQWFAPTRLSITFERTGQGRFTHEQIEQIVVRDKDGNVTALKLPSKSILIANHQVRHPILSV